MAGSGALAGRPAPGLPPAAGSPAPSINWAAPASAGFSRLICRFSAAELRSCLRAVARLSAGGWGNGPAAGLGEAAGEPPRGGFPAPGVQSRGCGYLRRRFGAFLRAESRGLAGGLWVAGASRGLGSACPRLVGGVRRSLGGLRWAVSGVFDGVWGSVGGLRAVVLCAGGWGEHAVAAFITVSRRVGGRRVFRSSRRSARV